MIYPLVNDLVNQSMCNYSVLYVDDDLDLLEICKIFLEKTGKFKVDVVASANMALDLIRSKEYDAIISDYQMPGMDGIEFLKKVKDLNSSLPFILFTGKGREEVVVEAYESGVDSYVQKGGPPQAQFSELGNRMEHSIRKCKAEMELCIKEKQLKESEERYRAYLEISPLAFSVVDPSLRYIESNDAFCRLLGYSNDELCKLRLQDIIVMDQPLDLTGELDKFVLKGQTIIELYLKKKDGAVFLAMIYGGKLPDGNLMAFVEDMSVHEAAVTPVTKSLNDLTLSEKKYRTIFERAPLGIATVNRDGMFVDFNQRYADILGYPMDEFHRLHYSQYTYPDDISKTDELFKALREGEIDHYSYEKRYIRKDGRVIWGEFFISTLDPHMQEDEAILAICNDITERKQMEKALWKSQDDYSRLVAAIPDFVIRTDSEGNITYVNDKVVNAVGISREELMGKSVYSFIAPQDLARAKANRDLMLSGPLGPVKYDMIMQDDMMRVFEVNGDVLRDFDGSIRGIVLLGRDVTERDMLEVKLHETYRKLKIANGITRHDILNRLIVLDGYLELALRSPHDEHGTKLIEKMRKNVEFLIDQVDLAMKYQRIGVERPEWQSLSKVCEEGASDLEMGDVQLILNVNGFEIMADPMFEKVFYNLMDNSLKHGGKIKAIKVSTSVIENGLMIVYEDDGMGIFPEFKDHLFQEGYGTDHGLGMFLCREILGITGIKIKENGIFGKGVRFEMKVPEGSFRTS